MPLESRSHMVSFRITREEHDRFRQLCRSHGLRNISDLVRTAVNRLKDSPGPDPLALRVANLESNLAGLAASVAQIEILFSKQFNPSDPVPVAKSTCP